MLTGAHRAEVCEWILDCQNPQQKPIREPSNQMLLAFASSRLLTHGCSTCEHVCALLHLCRLCRGHFRNVTAHFQSFSEDAPPHWFCISAELLNQCQALTDLMGPPPVWLVRPGQRSDSGQQLTEEETPPSRTTTSNAYTVIMHSSSRLEKPAF